MDGAEVGEVEEEVVEGGGGLTRNISDTQQIYLVKRYVYTSCLSLRILANHTMNLFRNKILNLD